MKQRILILLFFAVTIFQGCEEDDETFHKDGLWIPSLNAERGDKKVTFNWYSPGFYLMIYPSPDYADPDKIDIYISDSLNSDFQLYNSVDGNNYTYEIDGLENGKAYYFYVETRKKGYENRKSKKIMVIPSKPEETSLIKNIEKATLGLGDIKNGIKEIAYTNWNFAWNGGSNCCISSAVMVFSSTTGNNTVIDTFSSYSDWHPTKNQLLYVTEKGEIAVEGHRPSHFVIYDSDTRTFKHYPDGKNEIRFPVFTNDGKRIVYTKNPPDSGFELWQMEIETGTKKQLVAYNPFSDNSLLDADKPMLSPDDKYIYFEAARSTAHGGPLAIWRYNFQDESLNEVFESEWDDTNPAVSPNGSMLAFISDRSGNENIWVYNFITRRFIQITGSKGFSCRKGLGLLRWTNNNNIVFCGQINEKNGILSVGFS